MPRQTASKASTSTKKTTSVGAQSILEQNNVILALTYIPYFIGVVVCFFLGKNIESGLKMHHIKYSLFLAIVVMILSFILNAFFMKLVFLGYLIVSGYLAFQAYREEKVQVEFVDNIIGAIEKKMSK